MPSPAELSGGHEQSLEQQVIDLFVETRQRRQEFFEASRDLEEPRTQLETELEERIGELGEEEILRLAQPPALREIGEYSHAATDTIRTSQKLAEIQRQSDLRAKLRLAFIKRQSDKVDQLLEGKKITATIIPDDTKRFVVPIHGISHHEDSAVVSGLFRSADAGTTLLFIREESDDLEARMWSVQILDSDDSPLVRLQIED